MKLSKQTVDILNNFSTINNNLIIKPGKKIITMSVAKDVLAEYECEDVFDKTISIYNLSELLGAYSQFSDPELILDEKHLTIKQGKQHVKYVYADESLLSAPKKDITMPPAEIKLTITQDIIKQMQKMASILDVDDLAFIGDGKTVSIKVFDKSNPTANSFEIGLDVESTNVFNISFKKDRLRLYPSNYEVEISSKKISKWTSTSLKLSVYIAVEKDSTFK